MGFTIHNPGQGRTIRGLAFVATLVVLLFAAYHLYYFPSDLANVVTEGQVLYEPQLREVAAMARVDNRGVEIRTLQVKGMQNQEVTEELGTKNYRVASEIRDPQGKQVLIKKHRKLGPEEIKLLLNAQIKAIPVENQPRVQGKETVVEKVVRRKLPSSPEAWLGMIFTLSEDVYCQGKILSLPGKDGTEEKAVANVRLTSTLLDAMIKAGMPDVLVRDEGEVEVTTKHAGYHLIAAEAVVKNTFWSKELIGFVFLGSQTQITLGLLLSALFFLMAMGLTLLLVLNRPGYVDFLVEVESEMRKVTWPTWHEMFSSTGAVLLTVFVMGFYLWALDVAINFVMMKVIYAPR